MNGSDILCLRVKFSSFWLDKIAGLDKIELKIQPHVGLDLMASLSYRPN
jgi:hypothetical protein